MRVAFMSLYLSLAVCVCMSMAGLCFMGVSVLGGQVKKSQIIRQQRRQVFVAGPLGAMSYQSI